MQQFCLATTSGTAGDYKELRFVQPVRKMSVTSDLGPAYLRLVYSDASVSSTFYVPPRVQVFLDFQSANNGGGVNAISVADAGVATNVRFSIIEYGTGGDIDWYK